jgi:hypothetical protein
MSRDIVTGLQAGRSTLQTPTDQMNVILSGTQLHTVSYIQPPTQWVSGFFLGGKRPERYVDHSPSSSAKVKNERSYTSTHPICLHGTDTDNFRFC